MFSLNFFVIIFLAAGCHGSDPFVRTVTWKTYKEFIDYGWHYDQNLTRPPAEVDKPSELLPRLHALNVNNANVWGWVWTETRSGNEGTWKFKLDLDKKPEHCGILLALVKVKYYMENSSAREKPRFYSDKQCKYTCIIPDSKQGHWEVKEYNVALHESQMIAILIKLQPGGVLLFDEISLTYVAWQDEKKCPFSCNSNCKYRHIDCHNYYTCVDHKIKEFHSCKAIDGLAFNPKTNSCDLIENVSGCRRRGNPDPGKSTECSCQYKPHENNSTLYYYCPDTCQLKECELLECPSGLEWTEDAETGHYQCSPSGFIAW